MNLFKRLTASSREREREAFVAKVKVLLPSPTSDWLSFQDDQFIEGVSVIRENADVKDELLLVCEGYARSRHTGADIRPWVDAMHRLYNM